MKATAMRFPGISWIFAFVFINIAAAQDAFTPRIINGTPTAEFDSVGIIGTKQLGQFGTGTLISPKHVLTAAHAAKLVLNPTDGTFEVNGKQYTTSQIYIYPDYNSHTQKDDIAILELSQPVEGVTPSAIFRDTPQVGDLLTLVGFGAGGNGTTGQDGTFGVKMVGTTPIDTVTDTLITWRFDNNNESDTAYGDSGGPAFLLVDGEYLVAGVTSGGSDPNSMIGDVSFDTRVDAFAPWIDSFVAGNDSGSGDDGSGDDTGTDDGDDSGTGTDDGDDNGASDDDTGEPACPWKPGEHPGHGFHPGGGKHPWNSFHPGWKHPWGGFHPDAGKYFEALGAAYSSFHAPLTGFANLFEDSSAPPKDLAGEKNRSRAVSSTNRFGR